jgi:hypothetical protein
MDSIVVDNEATAIDMAQFLSSNPAMLRETFLPLDVLDPPQVHAFVPGCAGVLALHG